MMRRGSARFPWVVVVGLLCVGGLSCGREKPGLTLELRADKTRYLLDEPLLVTVVFDNRGTEDAPLIVVPAPVIGILDLEITAPGEQAHRGPAIAPGDFGPGRFVRPDVQVRPGGQYSTGMYLRDLAGGERRPLRSRPGEYVIRAHYATPERWEGEPVELWSDPLRLAVTEPEGVDRRAYAVLQKGAQATDGKIWGVGAERKEYYEQVLREYPESGYACYARHYLASRYSYEGSSRRRGTPEGAAALRRSAALRLAVAEEAGDTAFGVSAALGAGRTLATVGDTARAQAALEMAFTSPAATDEVRRQALSHLRDVESGYLHHASRLAAKQIRTPLALRLDRFAQALGLSVGWDQQTKTVTVSGPKVMAVLQPGEDHMVVNGKRVEGVRVSVKDGQVVVSPSVIGPLMAAQLGRDPAERW